MWSFLKAKCSNSLKRLLNLTKTNKTFMWSLFTEFFLGHFHPYLQNSCTSLVWKLKEPDKKTSNFLTFQHFTPPRKSQTSFKNFFLILQTIIMQNSAAQQWMKLYDCKQESCIFKADVGKSYFSTSALPFPLFPFRFSSFNNVSSTSFSKHKKFILLSRMTKLFPWCFT